MQMRKKLYIFKHLAKSKKLFFCQYLSFSVWFPLSLKHWSPLLRGLCQWVQLCTWSPNKLWRSNSILNLWCELSAHKHGEMDIITKTRYSDKVKKITKERKKERKKTEREKKERKKERKRKRMKETSKRKKEGDKSKTEKTYWKGLMKREKKLKKRKGNRKSCSLRMKTFFR